MQEAQEGWSLVVSVYVCGVFGSYPKVCNLEAFFTYCFPEVYWSVCWLDFMWANVILNVLK